MLNDLIAVSGLKGSGKNEAANMLKYLLNAPKPFRRYFWYKLGLKFPSKWRITSFAKPLKEVLAIILKTDVNKFEDRDFKENYFVSVEISKIIERKLLDDKDILSDNKFTKLIKSGNPLPPDTWLSIRQLMQYFGTEVCRKWFGESIWINATLNNISHPTIVSDLRFKNEFERVKLLKGKTIYINRDICKPGTHASEKELVELYNDNQFDFVVNNNNTLKDLFNNLKDIIWQVEK